MKFLIALALLALTEARLPIPYAVHVANGGLPLPKAILDANPGYWIGHQMDPEKWGGSDNVTGLIVGGSAASSGQFPYTVSLLRSGSLFCGGSIYNTRTIITAAHCTSGTSPSAITVRYNSLNHGSGGTTVSVSSIVNHGSYSSSTLNNDISVLRLASALTLGQTNAQAVTVASQGSDVTSGSVTAIGWGTTSEGGSLAAALRYVSVPVVSRSSCQNSYGGSSAVTTNMVCAGEQGKDSCQGDSGGPLVSGSTQVGIVSWGYGCARNGYPGVYTRIGMYNSWIATNAG